MAHAALLNTDPQPRYTALFSRKLLVKTHGRWVVRAVLLLLALVVGAAFFRYEYTSDKSVRVDRLTGKQEVFCQAQNQWTSLAACYPRPQTTN